MSRLVVIDAFPSSSLQNNRTLRVYLPPSYASNSDARYPVLYMHDGQNLFSQETAFANVAWDVHETVDHLVQAKAMREIIVVGIDNTTDRFSEYAYQGADTDGRGFIEGKGHLYAQFLTEEVIPHINAHFRTRTGPEHTAVMGSSMGGLISFHLALQNPHVFSMAGCLSSTFLWADNHTLKTLRQKAYPPAAHPKLWLDLGDGEGVPVEATREIVGELLEQGWCFGDDLAYFEVPQGGHFETDWAKRLHMPLLFFFGTLGRPLRLTLAGHRRVGLRGLTSWLNPIVRFDQGVEMTDLKATVTTTKPELLAVDSLGQFLPSHRGVCGVTVQSHGLRAVAEYTIEDELAPFVTVRLTVNVPAETPGDAKVFLGLVTAPDFLPLQQIAPQVYQGETSVPRNLQAVFAFTRGSRDSMEVFREAKRGGYRELTASEDMECVYTVQQWADIPAPSRENPSR